MIMINQIVEGQWQADDEWGNPLAVIMDAPDPDLAAFGHDLRYRVRLQRAPVEGLELRSTSFDVAQMQIEVYSTLRS